MSNALAIMDQDQLLADIAESNADDRSAQHAEGINDILKLLKYGAPFSKSPWVYGSNKTEVEPKSVWVIDPTTFRHGYFGWKGDGKGGQVSGQIPDGVWTPWNKKWPEQPADMPWCKDAYSFNAVCISSPSQEQIGAYVTLADNKKLGLKTYGAIEQALRQRAVASKGDPQLLVEFYPKVMFGYEEVFLKKQNTIFHAPVVTIVGWTDRTGVVEETLEANASAPDEDEAPARPARRRD
jgi:hypothetical protein